MKSYTGSTLTQTMYYFGNYEEKQNVKLFRYHYIYSPDGLVAIMKQLGTTKTMYWVAHDNLGSIMALFDQSRTKVQENSFDAWGRRRNPTNWTYNSVPATTIVTRGYTGHEHLDDFKLINMNGRVYDPVLGRFLSADQVLQFPENSQSYNKYSYVMNNPMKYVDPSGYEMSEWQIIKWLRMS